VSLDEVHAKFRLIIPLQNAHFLAWWHEVGFQGTDFRLELSVTLLKNTNRTAKRAKIATPPWYDLSRAVQGRKPNPRIHFQ